LLAQLSVFARGGDDLANAFDCKAKSKVANMRPCGAGSWRLYQIAWFDLDFLMLTDFVARILEGRNVFSHE
jgi:hypothetical protein